VGEAFEEGMALLSLERTGPGFALVHFAFELMENFLDVPTVFVEQNELIGRQGEVVGEVAVGHADFGIGVNDAPQDYSVRGADAVVGGESGFIWLAAVELVEGADFGGAVGFF
jgi:hypothetical protein